MYDTLVRNKKTEIKVTRNMENIQKTKELHYIQNTNNKSLLRSNQLKTENGREHKQVSQPSDETEIILPSW